MSTATVIDMVEDQLVLSKQHFKEAFSAYVEYVTDVDLSNFTVYKDNKHHNFKGHVCVVDGSEFPNNVVEIDTIKARMVLIQNCQEVSIGQIDARDVLIMSCDQVNIGEVKTNTLGTLVVNRLAIGEVLSCDKFVGFLNISVIQAGTIFEMHLCAKALQYSCRIMEPNIYTRFFAQFGKHTMDHLQLEFFMNTKSLCKLDNWLFRYDQEESEYDLRNQALTKFIFEYTMCGDFPVQWLVDPGTIPEFKSIMDKYNYLTKTTEAQRRKYIEDIKLDDGIFDFLGDLWESTKGVVDSVTDVVGDFICGKRDVAEQHEEEGTGEDPEDQSGSEDPDEGPYLSATEEQDPTKEDTPWVDPNRMVVRPIGTYTERPLTEDDIREMRQRMMDAQVQQEAVQPQTKAAPVTPQVEEDPMAEGPVSGPGIIPHIIGMLNEAATPTVGMGIIPTNDDPDDMADEVMGDIRVKDIGGSPTTDKK